MERQVQSAIDQTRSLVAELRQLEALASRLAGWETSAAKHSIGRTIATLTRLIDEIQTPATSARAAIELTFRERLYAAANAEFERFITSVDPTLYARGN